jgi:hypothetical protein
LPQEAGDMARHPSRPLQGWLSVHLGGLPDPALVGATWFARSFAIVKPKPYPASNDQSITLVP